MSYTIFDEMNLKNQAAQLENLAKKYDGIIEQIRQSSSKLNDWDSDAGEKWKSEVAKLLREATGTAQDLRNAASSIRAYTDSHKYLLEDEIGGVAENVLETSIKVFKHLI